MALLRIGGDHPWHGAIRHVDEGINQRQQDVGDAGVNNFAVGGEVRRVKRQHTDDAKRDRAPQQERTELAVTGTGAVHQQPHQRVGHRIQHARDQKQRAHNARRQAKHVGIKVGEQEHGRLPDKAAGGITQPVANFIFHG